MAADSKSRAHWAHALPLLSLVVVVCLFLQVLLRPNLRIEALVALVVGAGGVLSYWILDRPSEREQSRMFELLRVLNRPGDMRALIKDVVLFMRDWTGCSAVGVRLREDDDFPYFETRGFSQNFVRAENHLCARDAAGQIVRDSTGNPIFECMCGNILCGRFNPKLPFFSSHGSFWSNNTSKLLANTSEKDRQARTRNRCNGEGYESVALIPLRAGNEILGLLQFNDRAKNRFSPRLMHFLEEVADVIALSLAQRHAREMLGRHEVKYRQVVETAIEGIWILDADHRTTWVNHRCAEILGTSPEAMKGYRFDSFVHSEDRAEHRQRLLDCHAGKGERFEVRFVRPDGTSVWCSVALQAALNEDGQSTGSFAMVSDISERKQADEEREKLRAQLAQAQKLESVGRLAGGIAHDFNNMLSVINGHAEMALEQMPETNPIHRDLRSILNAGQRSAILTRQLLSFARQQPISPRVVDLNQIVGSMMQMLGRLIGEDIQLNWQPGRDVWPILIDPAQIDQILANLAVNARDAIAGVGRVRIETANVSLDARDRVEIPESSPGEYVRLCMSDTGCGMNEDTLARIFEPFFTTKRVGQGTGLGLATVYGVVKQNRGFLHVASEPGVGSTFAVYFPRSHESLTFAPETEGPFVIPRGRETLLVVEDEENVLSMLRGSLVGAGYEVLAMHTPEQALELSDQFKGRIDLLVTDLIMPGMNGRELAARLQERRPGLKCLYISGYPADSILNQGIASGSVSLIQKPFSLRLLAETVRDVIDGKAGVTTSSGTGQPESSDPIAKG